MLKLIFLDRNAVSLVKDSVAGKPQTHNKKIKGLNQLRKLDRKNIKVAGILSVHEGEKCKSQSEGDVRAVFRKEQTALTQFFKNAQVDLGIIDEEKVVEYATSDRSESWRSREKFLIQANDLIVSKVSKVKAKDVLNQLLIIAESLEIPPMSFTFQLVASCLFGNDDVSRKIIKPKKGKSNFYNELADINYFSQIELVGAMMRKRGFKSFKIEPVSFDDSLVKFINLTTISTEFEWSGTLTHSVGYDHKLFPNLNYDEYLAYFKSLGAEL